MCKVTFYFYTLQNLMEYRNDYGDLEQLDDLIDYCLERLELFFKNNPEHELYEPFKKLMKQLDDDWPTAPCCLCDKEDCDC